MKGEKEIIRYDIIIAALLLTCVGALASGIYFWLNRSRLKERMEQVNRQRIVTRRNVLRLLSSHFLRLLQKAGINSNMAALDRKLFLSGRPFNLSAEEFCGAWITLAAAAMVAGTILALSGVLQPLFAFGLVALAGFLPHLVVDAGAGAGRNRLGTETINLILRLELGTSAGLTPIRVLEWASEGNSLLAQLLKSLTREVAMGKLTHVVFTRLADDYGVPEAREVAVSLKQAEVQGLPISGSLADLSRDLRDSREREAEIQIVKMRPSIEGILTATMMVAAITLMVGPLAAENIGVINHMVDAATPYSH